MKNCRCGPTQKGAGHASDCPLYRGRLGAPRFETPTVDIEREYPVTELRHRDRLLSDIASGFLANDRRNLVNLRVRLFHGDEMVKEYLGGAQALDAVVEGVYWDDEGNWSEADSAKVDTY